MLDPDTLEDLGNLVGAIYSEMEAEMCDILVRAILDNDVGFWKSQAALAMLAQAQAPQLRMVLERYRDRISKATYQEVEDALTRSDDYDLERLQDALGYEIPRISTVQITMAAQKVGEMLERDNLDMLTGARQALYREVSTAIAQVTGGLKSPHEATLEATRSLARHGIEVVQYKDPTTGDKTVRNKADVAVRRHIRSQMSQAAAERTMQVCDECGCTFVEVSSHYGARPSHQDWEGRVYSLNGRVTVDGVTYEDFGEATGYYGEGDHGALGDRLQGVNCRHHFGPWLPGMPRAFHPNPKHPSGKSNEEIYKLTQKQRALERALRDTKRELSAALENYKRYPNEKTQLAVNQLKAQLKSQNDKMKALLAENKGILTRQPARESVGNLPRVNVPEASGSNIDEYLHDDGVQKTLKSMGITLGGAETAMRRMLADNDMSTADFKALSASQQRAMTDSGKFHYLARTASTANNRISTQKQAKHVEGTKGHEKYRTERAEQGKSYQSVLRITQDEAQALVHEHAGKGRTEYDKNDRWRKLEYCEADHIIGVYYDVNNEPHETMRFMIMYANKNVHIVPVKEVEE